MEIVGKCTKYESDEKRFYIPGCKIVGSCPSCGAKWESDFGNDYLSYPTINAPFMFYCYCPKCHHEWQEKIRVNITLELVTK